MTDLRKTAVYIRLPAEDDNVYGRAKKVPESAENSSAKCICHNYTHMKLLSLFFSTNDYDCILRDT